MRMLASRPIILPVPLCSKRDPLAEFAKISVIKPAELHGLSSNVLTELLGHSEIARQRT